MHFRIKHTSAVFSVAAEFTTECCSYEAVDCFDIMKLGMKESGVYSVTPAGTHSSFMVYCDMDKNSEAWLVKYHFIDPSNNSKYSRTSVARTLMAYLPRLFRTRS